jgi:hypothetical protein
VILIEANTVDTPTDAEMLMEQLWQLTMGRRFGLFLVGTHGDPGIQLGVSCHSPRLEAIVADTVSRWVKGDQHLAPIGEMLLSSHDLAAVTIRHVNRMVPQQGGNTWGWQRPNYLKGVYDILEEVPVGGIAGVGVTLRSLPGAMFEMCMTSFATGPGASLLAWTVATAYAGVGSAPRTPFPSQRRAVRLMLQVRFRWPRSRQTLAVVSSFWHPPFKLKAPMVIPWAS